MTTVRDIDVFMTKVAPKELSEEWDNDGVMCCADFLQEVNKVIITLDVTEEVVDYAIESCVDLIISHHPLIFKPLTSICESNHVARKVIKLLEKNLRRQILWHL
jgi:putative NIF3 family GTP cyclohydrolase 1 type 2